MKNIFIAAVIIIVVFGIYKHSKKSAPVEMNHDSIVDDSGLKMNNNSETAVSEQSTTDTQVATKAGVKEFTVNGDNFKFAPNNISVNKGDTVTIHFKNTGGFHDLKIDEFNVATKQIQSGAEETITFVADKAGTFEYYCSVGSNRSMGMKGTLTVK